LIYEGYSFLLRTWRASEQRKRPPCESSELLLRWFQALCCDSLNMVLNIWLMSCKQRYVASRVSAIRGSITWVSKRAQFSSHLENGLLWALSAWWGHRQTDWQWHPPDSGFPQGTCWAYKYFACNLDRSSVKS
jgi:hypothetical protein